MIEKNLELVLITYNRSKYLEKTFLQLLESPFLKCKLTILDNCSTDETPDICKKYQKLFPNMTIIRHPKNIGANPNILRAVETSNSLYTWILCDDDYYDFSECDDIINAILLEKYDIIMPYSGQFVHSEGKTINELLKERNNENKLDNYLESTGKELFAILKHYYFILMTFVPATIFKTEIYDSDCFIEGYDNVPNMYPHFPYVVKSIEDDLSIYKSKKDIITRGDHSENRTYAPSKWAISWLESSLILEDKNKIKIVTNKYFNNYSLLPMIIYAVIQSKADKEPNFKNQTISLIAAVIKTQGLIKGGLLSLLIIILSIIPSYLANILKSNADKYSERIRNENIFDSTFKISKFLKK